MHVSMTPSVKFSSIWTMFVPKQQEMKQNIWKEISSDQVDNHSCGLHNFIAGEVHVRLYLRALCRVVATLYLQHT